MRALLAYLLRHWKLTVFLTGSLGICCGVLILYDLPVEVVIYSAALCGALGAVLFAVGYLQFLRRHRELEHLLMQVRETVIPLPGAKGLLEEDYQALVEALAKERTALAAENRNRLQEMTDYYTLWAHQIKTPIAAMHLLLQEEPWPELEGELLKIEQYVEMVLGYLRLDSGSTDYVLRSCKLDDLIRKSVRKYARLFILKKISLDFRETGKTVLTDEKWLCFVMEQLLSNALKYTASGGRIRVYGDGDTLVIVDNGIGIQPEDLPRVCEKGFTGYNGREDKKSTGIGLYLCAQVMERLNHGMTIASRPGKARWYGCTYPASRGRSSEVKGMAEITREVLPEEDGITVKHMLKSKLHFSSHGVSRLAHGGECIFVNGKPVHTPYVLRAGDVLRVESGDLRPPRTGITPGNWPLRVVWEDEHLLIVDKPAGMTAHASNFLPDTPTVAGALAWKRGTEFIFHPVNRLDKGTTGLMVIAKSGYVHELLRRELHTEAFRREYRAICAGCPAPERGTIQAPIGRDEESTVARKVRPDGAEAVSHYEVLSKGERLTYVALHPETGRTHQLRVHMAYIGCPLAGDWLYGTEDPALITRPALHSSSVTLRHPVTGETLQVRAPLPEDMKRLLGEAQ